MTDYDHPSITLLENFFSKSHQEIINAVQPMRPALTVDIADMWNKMSTGFTTIMTELHDELLAQIAPEHWSGLGAQASIRGVEKLSESANSFNARMLGVHTQLHNASSTIEKVRDAIPDPVTVDDSFMNQLPIFGDYDDQVRQAAAATEKAQKVMSAIYSPGATNSDSAVPTFIKAHNPARIDISALEHPVAYQNALPQSSSPTPQPNGPIASPLTTPSAGSPDTTTAAATTAPASPYSGNQNPSSSNPFGTQSNPLTPTATTPAAAALSPLSTPAPLSRAARMMNDNHDFRPSVFQDSYTTPKAPAKPANPVSGYGTGSSTSGYTSGTSTAGTRGVVGANGAPGMGGMGPISGAGAGKRRSEDEDERDYHPDYLITIGNGKDLFGPIRKVVPPVIGDWNDPNHP